MNWFDSQKFIRLVFTMLCVFTMIQYYSTPLPWLGMNMHQIVTDEAHNLSNQLESGVEQRVQERLDQAYVQLEAPWGWNLVTFGYYMLIVCAIAAMKLALLAIIGFSYVALGLITIFGPLFLNALLWPGLEFLFWGWFKAFLQYAFYQVVAAGTVFLTGNVMIQFLDANPGPYTLGKLESITLEFLAIALTLIYFLFKVPSLASSIFTGRAGESLVGERHW
jgi:TrbL/VirB6 plasmid conjugal transfer protein